MELSKIALDILPSGHIRFRRGDREYNKRMREIISFVVDNDETVLREIDDFLIGSEDVELLIGDTILCG
jgi:hypothetical protein